MRLALAGEAAKSTLEETEQQASQLEVQLVVVVEMGF
jgi:hypothetical protein